MTSATDTAQFMLETVANTLGDDLLQTVAFVGGCTTGLLVTDEFSRQGIRFTDDVDLIVGMLGKGSWQSLRDQLIERGFHESHRDPVMCRLRINDIKVDFMPDDADVLGFTNRWYKVALNTARPYRLTSRRQINLVTPPLYVATKFEAYKGRGEGDLLGSHDIEDILTLVDGRPELAEEIRTTQKAIASYIADEFISLTALPDILYAVQSTSSGNAERADLILDRIDAIIAHGSQS